jgi:hypothetical protein
MTPEHKLIISTALLPVLADFLEDVPMNRLAKMRRETVVNSIRAFDRMYTNTEKTEDYQEAMEQQNNIQLAFRNWLDEAFKDLEL